MFFSIIEWSHCGYINEKTNTIFRRLNFILGGCETHYRTKMTSGSSTPHFSSKLLCCLLIELLIATVIGLFGRVFVVLNGWSIVGGVVFKNQNANEPTHTAPYPASEFNRSRTGVGDATVLRAIAVLILTLAEIEVKLILTAVLP